MTNAPGPVAGGPRPSEQNRRVLLVLGACAFAAMVVGAIGQVVLPARGSPVLAWLDTAVVPAAVAILLVINRRNRPALLAVTIGLLYVEAILTASLFEIGVAFAIVVPIIGIGLVGARVRGNASIAAYVGAWAAATLSITITEIGNPPNPLRGDEPAFTVIAFALVSAAALGLMWRMGDQQVKALVAAGREIEARTAAEAELERAGEFLKTLVGSSPVATIALDREGIVTLWNPAAERVFGWTGTETVGRSLPDALVASVIADQPGLPDRITRSLTGDPIRGDLVHCRRKDGTDVIVEVHADARTDPAGHPAGVILQAIDETNRAKLEAQLLQARKMEAVGQLAGGIAHDINNALAGMGGFAELIETAADDPAIRDDARTISEGVMRAGQLTRQLLAFARRGVLQPQVIDTTTFLESILPVLQRLLGTDIAVVLRLVPGPAWVEVDPGEFEQALVNLAVNAREAMPGGGTLTVTTRRREPDPERAAVAAGAPSSTQPGPSIVLTVADTGTGIAPEVLGQVFEPFYTTKETGQGSGLGLAMVYGFATRTGGAVEIRSEPGEGTTVEIRLPEVTGPPSPPTRASLSTMSGGETILLIDDEPAVARFVARVLTDHGYRVIQAVDGISAIEAARAHPETIELILSDVIIPGMSGPEAVEAIRVIHPESAVLFASGYTADAIAEQGVIPDGVALIEKPFTAVSLATRVRQVLESRDPRGGNPLP